MVYEGLESTADTTGTFDVHRCCEVFGMFSDVSLASQGHGRRWSWLMLQSLASHNGVFGCQSDFTSSDASPGTRETRLFQRPFRRPTVYEGHESAVDTTGTLDVHRCCEVFGMFSDVSLASQGYGHQSHGRCRVRSRIMKVFSDTRLICGRL
jgi:hypothetical protein